MQKFRLSGDVFAGSFYVVVEAENEREAMEMAHGKSPAEVMALADDAGVTTESEFCDVQTIEPVEE